MACMALIAAQNIFILFIYNIADLRDYYLFPMWLGWLGLWCAAVHGIAAYIGRFSRTALAAYAILLLPAMPLLLNYRDCNMSKDFDAEELSEMILPASTTEMPEGSILITGGDMDTFSSWYRQNVRNERADVLVYAGNFNWMPWYRNQFTPDQIKRYQLRFADGVAHDPAGFAKQLADGVISQNLGKHPVYIFSADQYVLQALSENFRLSAARHLSNPEFPDRASAILYLIQSK